MGFDFRSVSPKFSKPQPKAPRPDERNAEKLEKHQKEYQEWESNTSYLHFRLSGGGWTPILQVLKDVNEECKLGIDMTGWDCNDRKYSGDWHVCQLLAEKTIQHKEEKVRTVPGLAAFIIYMQNSGGFVIG